MSLFGTSEERGLGREVCRGHRSEVKTRVKGGDLADMLFLIKIILFVIIFIQIFYLLINLRGKFNKDIQEAKDMSYDKRGLLGRIFKDFSNKFVDNNYYKNLENYLLKAGNPLNLTPIIYVFLKILLTLLIPIYAYINYQNFQMTFLGLLTGFFVLDIIILIEKRNRRVEILNDLPDVIDSLRIQVLSGIPLTSAIQELYKIPKNKSLKRLLELLSARYSITKDMTMAVEEFRRNFDVVEIEGLCLTLEQNETTGSSLGLLQNQSEILQANYIFKIQKDTKNKEYIVIFAMILILVNIASIILYPIISQINQSLKTIFS